MGAGAEHIFVFAGLASVPLGLAALCIAAIRRNRRWAAIGAMLLTVFVVAILRVRYAQFWEIDACLDHGGSFNYDAEKCEYENDA